MPSEFPERWSRFLPPDDVTARLRTQAKNTQARDAHKETQNGSAPER
jgi:membrane protein